MRRPAGIRVRAASHGDLAALFRCDPCSATDPKRQGLIADAVARGQCQVAERGDVALGFVLLTYEFFEQGFIPLVAVAPEFRRQGVGLELLQAAVGSCATARLFTSTNSSNLGAQALLSRAGFVRSGVVENLDVGDPELIYFQRAAPGTVRMPQLPRSSSPVSDLELLETVRRMEARLGPSAAPGVAPLLEAYRALVPRFETDLGHSSREIALAKASALMLIQEVARAEDAS